MSQRRHWYHVSKDDHGPTWRVGKSRPSFISTSEPLTPRLCVCRTVAGCLAAALFQRDAVIYRTAAKRRTVRPVGVWDAAITGERWIVPVPPVEMVRIATIPHAVLEPVYEEILRHLWMGNKGVKVQHRARSYSMAVAAVSRWDRSLVSHSEGRWVEDLVKMVETRMGAAA